MQGFSVKQNSVEEEEVDEKSLTGSDALEEPVGGRDRHDSGLQDNMENRSTMKKQVTKKMSVKGRCRVLTIVESLVEESAVESSPLLKVPSLIQKQSKE